jgi:PhzF family phenazine biosynthesis protein
MKVHVDIINAFVDGESGGNPAGVVLDADTLDDTQKQIIAAKVGYSETAFVSSSKSADFKLEFFTPTRQIAHCGHATIATFSYLKQIDRIKKNNTSKETIDGNRDIFLEEDMAYMEQRSPKYTDINDPIESIVSSFGIKREYIREDSLPVIVNTGNSFLIVPLKNESSVLAAKPDLEAITEISEKYDLIGFYIFSLDTRVPKREAGTRMFAPRYGVSEESATGMAAGPLGCYLYDKMGIDKDTYLIEQGHLMTPPSPSVITVKLSIENKKIKKLMVGGMAKVMTSLEISL